MEKDSNNKFYSCQNIFCEFHCLSEEEEKAVLAVISNPAKWPFKASKYAFIMHDKDIDDDGQEKVHHWHFIAMTDKKQGKQKWLDMLEGMLPIKREAIGIEPMRTERGSLRYLVHRTDESKDKFQYPLEDVNSFPPSWFENAMKDKRNNDPSWEEISACETEEHVYNLVGLKDYHKAKEAWKDTQNGRLRQEEVDYYRDQLEGALVERRDTIYCLKKWRNAFKILVDVDGEAIRKADIRPIARELTELINKLEGN